MNEPTTVEEAKQLTLDKIKRCMELPPKERADFWFTPIWLNWSGVESWCAFCILARKGLYPCSHCPAEKPCDHYQSHNSWSIPHLRKLYKMVEAIEC